MSASTGSRNTASSPVGRVSGRRKAEASAGESVSALNAEIAIENAMVSENCLYRIPVVPGKRLTGTKTEISTREVAITALVTSAIAMMVALCGSCTHSSVPATVCPSRWRCTFSITTIASSTTSPVASVIPNSVSELMEKSKSRMKAKVPISETGIVMAGMMVARQSCKNRKITRITMTMAAASVFSTSTMESCTTVVVSTATNPSSPGGNDFCSSASTALQRVSTLMALALESCCTPSPTASPPEYFSRDP